MQNFSSLALKLREEFDVTDRKTTGAKIYHCKNSNFSTHSLRLLVEDNSISLFLGKLAGHWQSPTLLLQPFGVILGRIIPIIYSSHQPPTLSLRIFKSKNVLKIGSTLSFVNNVSKCFIWLLGFLAPTLRRLG